MDSKLSRQQEIERLIRNGDNARWFISSEVRTLKAKLDVPSRVRNSLKGNPLGWLFGSAASGMVASLLFRRKSARSAGKKSSARPIRFLALILTLVRPIAKVWLTGRVKSYLSGESARFFSNLPDHPRDRSFQPLP